MGSFCVIFVVEIVLKYLARFPSGQRGRTVNPLAKPSQVRILLSPPVFALAKAWASSGRPVSFGLLYYQ